MRLRVYVLPQQMTAGRPPVEEPPEHPPVPPVEEPGKTPEAPPSPDIPPAGDPDRLPRRPPVEAPPPEEPGQKVRGNGARQIFTVYDRP